MIDVPDEPPPSIRMTRPRMAGSPACVLDRPRRVLLVCAVALWGAFASPPAHAEPEAFVSAYKAGKTALQSGAFQDALDHFRLSLRQAGEHQAASWKGMIGVAFAFRGLDEPGYALEYYRRFLDGSAQHESMLPPKWRARREAVQAEVAELETLALETHAMVPVTSSPPGAHLTINGLTVGADGAAKTPYPLYLKPGQHLLTASLEGHDTVTKTLTVSAGELMPISLTLVATAPDTPQAPVVTPSETETDAPAATGDEGGADPTWEIRAPGVEEEVDYAPYVLLSSGGVAALAAIGLTVGAAMKHQELEKSLLKYGNGSPAVQALTGKQAKQVTADMNATARARDDMQLASNIFYSVGVAAVIGGVIWMLVIEEEPEDAEPSEAMRLVPVFGFTPTSEGAMTSATWRF